MFNHTDKPYLRRDPAEDLGVERRDGVGFEERKMDDETDGLGDLHLYIPTVSCFERTVDSTVPVIGDPTRPSSDDYYPRKLARLAAAKEADQ